MFVTELAEVLGCEPDPAEVLARCRELKRFWRHGPDELPAKDDLVLAWRRSDDPDTTSYTIASVTDLEPIGREPGLYWIDTHWVEVWPITEETYWVPLPEAPQ